MSFVKTSGVPTAYSEKRMTPKIRFSNFLKGFSFLFALTGLLIIGGALFRILSDDDDKRLQTSSAVAALHDLGTNLIRQIETSVAPAIQRTKKLAANPAIGQAILSGDCEALTGLCNREVCNSTEIDTVSLFDASGKILAINVVYADGSPVPIDRVNKVMGKRFEDRPIISHCVSDQSDQEALEFQTHCDITPAYFDSTGLAVAYSVPVFDPVTKAKIGVVSTRLRFERISSLVTGSTGQWLGNVFLVTDHGEYFSESINSGKIEPPILSKDLKAFVAPMVAGNCSNSHVVLKDSFLELFRLNNCKTLDGGGIQVMVIGNLDWIERESRLASLVTFGAPLGVGFLLVLSGGIAWSGARLSIHRDRLLAVEASKQRLATIIECSEDAIIIEQTDGTIGYWNAGAQRLFGYSADETINQPISLLVPPELQDSKARLFEALLSGGRISQFETVRLAKDGSRVPVSIAVSSLRDDAGRITGFSKIVRDIRVHKAAEEELDRARLMAEAANQSKSDFLANMSHEIRTPMTAILGFADLLDSDGEIFKESSFAKNAVETIRSNANHLLSIINDILDMSKIDAGKMTIECIEFSPSQTLAAVMAIMQSQSQGKGIALKLEVETKLPSRIKSDPTRLRQILLNLVGNAIKFTEVGEVVLHVAYLAESSQLQFRIVDTGIGMTQEQLAVIAKFGAFAQADTSTTRQFGGSGLGLRISNSLAKMLGGKLHVDSEIGRGSVFTATISVGNLEGMEFLDYSNDEVIMDRPSRSEATIGEMATVLPLEGIKILLAEDGPDNQRLISFLFKKAGADVTLAENGLIAAEIIESNCFGFDVVFMDMQMPEMDGYDATRRLRSAGCMLPIIALTAHAMQSDREKCIEAGCNDYTTKPIDRKVLIEMASHYGRRNSTFPMQQQSSLKTSAQILEHRSCSR